MTRRRKRSKWADLPRAALIAFLPNIAMLAAYRFLIAAGIYSFAPWLDNPLHVAGGAGLAWAFFVFWSWGIKKRLVPRLPYWAAVFFAVGIAATAGILWEQYEFLWDLNNSGGWLTPNVADFVKDLTNDLLGAFIFALFAAKKMIGPKRK